MMRTTGGRAVGSDFDQIQPCFLRHPERRVHLQNPELCAVGADHADRADADLRLTRTRLVVS